MPQLTFSQSLSLSLSTAILLFSSISLSLLQRLSRKDPWTRSLIFSPFSHLFSPHFLKYLSKPFNPPFFFLVSLYSSVPFSYPFKSTSDAGHKLCLNYAILSIPPWYAGKHNIYLSGGNVLHG